MGALGEKGRDLNDEINVNTAFTLLMVIVDRFLTISFENSDLYVYYNS